jgi:hypothetical protein
MNEERQKLIDRARELNSGAFSVNELQERIYEVCSEYLIEAKVDVDLLLRHEDWRVRDSALEIVCWGIGATDGIDQSIAILMHDSDEDVRCAAARALWQCSRSPSKKNRMREALMRSAKEDESQYVRECAEKYLRTFDGT